MFLRVLASSMIVAVCASGTAIAQITTSGVTLVQNGGTFGIGNLAAGATAFAPNIEGQTAGPPQPIGYFGAHTTTGVNNLAYGNSLSWLAGAAGSYVGLNLGGSFSVSSVAFGRDNAGAFGDRSFGLVTLEYTTDPTPSLATGTWTNIGTINFTGPTPNFGNAARHRFNFAPVTATGLRLVTAIAGRGIDEFEVYSNTFTPPTLSPLVSTIQDEGANAFGLGFVGVAIPAEPAPGDGQYRHANGPGSYTWMPMVYGEDVKVETSWGVSLNHSRDVDFYFDPDGSGPMSEIALLQNVDQTFFANGSANVGVNWSGFLTIAEGLDLTPQSVFRVTGTNAGNGIAPQALSTAAWRFTAAPEPASLVVWLAIGLCATIVTLRLRRK